VKVVEVIETPLADNVTLVMSAGFPVPVTDIVNPVMLIADVVLGFVKRTC
jgi:hypothetical protein